MFHMEHQSHRHPAGSAGCLCRNSGGLQPESQPDCYHRPGGRLRISISSTACCLPASRKWRGRMVDVGAGAGFPGIVTKIFKPELELTLMEPTGKRVEFLKYACAQLGLDRRGVCQRNAPRKPRARRGVSSSIWHLPGCGCAADAGGVLPAAGKRWAATSSP